MTTIGAETKPTQSASGASSTGEVLVSDVPACMLCGECGRLMYDSLGDRYFSVPGQWNFSRCDACGLIWLNPRPLASETTKLYSHYYTHVVPAKRSALRQVRQAAKHAILASRFGYSDVPVALPSLRMCGRLLAMLRPLWRKAEREVFYLSGRRRGRLLDVGSGDGSFISQMRDLGWTVYGVEPDPKAAQIARDVFKCDIQIGTVSDADFPEAFFDAITLSHVIEHVPDPVAVLRRCRAWLNPGGTLVVATPNGSALGHRLFKSSWRELDPPRHFWIFTPETLGRCLELAGFQIERVATSSRNASRIWSTSRQIRQSGRMDGNRIGPRLQVEGALFSIAEKLVETVSPRPVSEEITIIARVAAAAKRAT